MENFFLENGENAGWMRIKWRRQRKVKEPRSFWSSEGLELDVRLRF